MNSDEFFPIGNRVKIRKRGKKVHGLPTSTMMAIIEKEV